MFKKIVSWPVAVWLSEPSHMGAALALAPSEWSTTVNDIMWNTCV